MKNISKKEFLDSISSMYGNTTCVVYDSPDNRYNYSSLEVSESNIPEFYDASEIEEMDLEENSAVASVMIQNFAADFEPANNVQDDDYVPMIRKTFGPDSKLYVAICGNSSTYLLCYE